MLRLMLTLLLFAAPLLAQAPLKVGDLAPEIQITYWLDNPPEMTTLSEMRGDVALLHAWSNFSDVSRSQVAAVNELHEKYAGKGLHVIGMYGLNTPLDEIRKEIAERKIRYPHALNWIDYDNNYDYAELPRIWVVGGDGKIKFIGEKDFTKVVEAELAQVKWPGLGGIKVVPELEAAARAVGEMNYIKAAKLAQTEADKEDVPAAVAACAKAILEQVDARLKTLRNRAETAEVEENWKLAFATWQLIEKRFAGHEDASDVPERVSKLKADKMVQLEIAAGDEIRVIDRALSFKKALTREWIVRYKEFAARYEGTSWEKKVTISIKAMEEEEKASEGSKG